MGYCSGELDGAKRSVFKMELVLDTGDRKNVKIHK
jgi:hypothetical protein